MKSLEDIFPSIPFTMFFLFFCDGTGQGFPPRRWQEKTPPMTHTGTHTLLPPSCLNLNTPKNEHGS